jgi:MFS family permease
MGVNAPSAGLLAARLRETLVREAPAPRQVLIAALVAQTSVSVMEQGVPSLTGYIKDDFSLSASLAGLVVSSVLLGKVFASYAMGTLVDSLGERRMLVVSALGAGTLAAAASGMPLPLLVACLVAAGFFSAAATPAGGRMIILSFPRERRGAAMGLRQTGVPLGGVVAALMLPVIASGIGWRWALAVAGIVTLIGGLVALRVAGVERHRASEKTTERGRWLALVRDRDLVLTTLWACLLVSGQYAVLAFLALDIRERGGFSLPSAVAFLAVAQAGGVIGRAGWGFLSDRSFGGQRLPLLACVTGVGLVSTVTLAVLPSEVGLIALLAVTFLAGLSLLGWPGLWITLICEIAGPWRAGAATGFALTFVTVASFASPPIYGLIVDLTHSFRAMWLALALVLLASLGLLKLIHEKQDGPTVGPPMISP